MGVKIRDLGLETDIQNADKFVIADSSAVKGTRAINWSTIKSTIDTSINNAVAASAETINESINSGPKVVMQAVIRCSDGSLLRNTGFHQSIKHAPGKFTLSWQNAATVKNSKQYTVVLTRVHWHPYEDATCIVENNTTAERSTTSFTIWNANDESAVADSIAIQVAVII